MKPKQLFAQVLWRTGVSQGNKQWGHTHPADPGNHHSEVEIKVEVEGELRVAVATAVEHAHRARQEEAGGMSIPGIEKGYLVPSCADEDMDVDAAGEEGVEKWQVVEVVGAALKYLECQAVRKTSRKYPATEIEVPGFAG